MDNRFESLRPRIASEAASAGLRLAEMGVLVTTTLLASPAVIGAVAFYKASDAADKQAEANLVNANSKKPKPVGKK